MRLIDLDASQEPTTVVVRYKSVVTPLTRDRVLELLAREEQALTLLLQTGMAPAAAPRAANAAPMPLPPDPATVTAGIDGGPITHASLSTRIKKIHDYSAGTRKVRPTHAGLLAEVLAAFDWQIPPHANTHLVEHLNAIRTWQGVSAQLQADIDQFLTAYTTARDEKKTG